jgi:hypothetical protein
LCLGGEELLYSPGQPGPFLALGGGVGTGAFGPGPQVGPGLFQHRDTRFEPMAEDAAFPLGVHADLVQLRAGDPFGLSCPGELGLLAAVCLFSLPQRLVPDPDSGVAFGSHVPGLGLCIGPRGGDLPGGVRSCRSDLSRSVFTRGLDVPLCGVPRC